MFYSLKCKMCGGALTVDAEKHIGTCDYCGSVQTVPTVDDEKKANLLDRANHFRVLNEYDKALGLYEKVLELDSNDAEVYWSMVLCRYGICYVEDPKTHKRIPTINRMQYASILNDADYLSALEHANSYQKEIYEQEAKTIDEIQKNILKISKQEKPYDVFICYKETDDNGQRTKDSVLANDLYHQLTNQGMKVFYAKITLESKLGQEYEPYIFAALNSATAMIVLGTKKEFFTAPWVKNEWSRYLNLTKENPSKVLIPAYKDMDPYDLPDEFSSLQALDMSKLGFVSDLVQGIKKIKTVANSSTNIESALPFVNGNPSALLIRAKMAIEDGEFGKADDFCEQVLNVNPQNADAYLYKFMADWEITSYDQLFSDSLGITSADVEDSLSFRHVLRFGNKEDIALLKNMLEDKKEKENMEWERYRLLNVLKLKLVEKERKESERLEREKARKVLRWRLVKIVIFLISLGIVYYKYSWAVALGYFIGVVWFIVGR